MRSVLNEDNIFDVLQNVKIPSASSIAKGETKADNYIGGSISNYAKKLTMSFPVLCDDSISLDTAQLISRANERNIASMLEMLFTSMSMQGNAKVSGAELLAQYHNNIDALGIDDYIDIANSAARRYMKENRHPFEVNAGHVREALNEMTTELRAPKKRFPVSSFSARSLNEYTTRDNYGDIKVIPLNEASKEDKEEIARLRRELSATRYSKDKEADRLRGELQAAKADAKGKVQDSIRSGKYDAKSRILDADFKKSNELQPTPIVVNYNVVGKDDTVVDRVSFIAGVKCRLIASSALEIAQRLMSVKKTKLTFKDLIRATTGEIKFTKDFLLAIDQQKIDARNDSKNSASARLWNVLKKRSVKNSARKALRDKNDATAITTLIVSQDTANALAANGFDITIPKNAQLIMDSYNLLCLVVADDANEVAKFLYDGNSEFEMLAYSVLSKEALDQHYRKEINLLRQ